MPTPTQIANIKKRRKVRLDESIVFSDLGVAILDRCQYQILGSTLKQVWIVCIPFPGIISGVHG